MYIPASTRNYWLEDLLTGLAYWLKISNTAIVHHTCKQPKVQINVNHNNKKVQ